MLREAQSRTGRKALMAVVLAPTPAQFNGTAVLQKHGVKVYTSQQVAARFRLRVRRRNLA